MSSPVPRTISSYLARRAVGSPWRMEPPPERGFTGAVVIPARAESANLPHTLASLAANPRDLLDRFMVIVVVNNRADADPAEKDDNRKVLELLSLWHGEYGPALCMVDAASPGRELPPGEGVGLARRIGMDLALNCLDHGAGDPLLVCLDADTLVRPDYLAAIVRHFSASPAGAASLPFRHQPAADQAGQAAIDRYELFLRGYVLGLRLAGSPYAFHTVGSAMACRASAYAAAGGMNRRLAGEDFYFLQQMHKVAGVGTLHGTTVYPSPRSSHRVPFGTGRSVGDMLRDGEQRVMFYKPQLFEILEQWLACVAESPDAGGDGLLRKAGGIYSLLREFLEEAGFAGARDTMLRQCRDQARLAAAFHGWFDAFRTMRLIHHLTDRCFGRVGPEQALPPLLERAGYEGPETVTDMLVWLQIHDGAVMNGGQGETDLRNRNAGKIKLV